MHVEMTVLLSLMRVHEMIKILKPSAEIQSLFFNFILY